MDQSGRSWFDQLKNSIDRCNDLLDLLWDAWVIKPILRWRKWRCNRAKLYLLRHDANYREKFLENKRIRDQVRERDPDTALGQLPTDGKLLPNGKLPELRWPQKDPTKGL